MARRPSKPRAEYPHSNTRTRAKPENRESEAFVTNLNERKRNAAPRILDAARRIAARDGAGRITIDGVALESGLSKGGVLYNFRTKNALLAGLLDDMIVEHRSRLASVQVDKTSPTLRGHLASLQQVSQVEDDVSMAILAVAAESPELLDPLREELSRDLARITSEATDETGAIILLLAIQGFTFHKLLSLPKGGSRAAVRS